MNIQLTNLFPQAVKKGAIELFGEQSLQPVLLRLVPADTATGHDTAVSNIPELLHPKEKTILSGYRLAKRRAEYLTGRICAKKAAHIFLTKSSALPEPLRMPDIEIATTTIGRPNVYLHRPHRPFRMDISISHSGDYGAALAAESRCGIDLQMQKTTLLQVQEKYCSNAEYRLLETSLADYGTLPRLTVLWAAKEAGKKALSYWQMPGFLDLQLWKLKRYPDYITITMRVTNIKNHLLPNQITVVAGMFGDYALAICLVREDDCNA